MLAMHRHRDDLLRQTPEGAQERASVLGGQCAANQNQRARCLFLKFRHGGGEHPPAVLIVPAVEPQFRASRDHRHKPPAGQVLQPRRPLGLEHALFIGCGGQVWHNRAQSSNGSGRIAMLVAAGQARQRQVKQAALIGVDQPPQLLAGRKILPADGQRRMQPPRLALQHEQRTLVLRRQNGGDAALDNSSFLESDFVDCGAQKLRMVNRYRRHHAGKRTVNHIGRVKAPAKANLQQQVIGRDFGEQQKCGGGGDFENGNRRAAIGQLAALENLLKLRVVRQLAAAWRGQPDALIETHQMRRGIDMRALARRLQDGAHKGDSGALAIGAGHMDDRRQAAAGIAKRFEQARDAPE